MKRIFRKFERTAKPRRRYAAADIKRTETKSAKKVEPPPSPPAPGSGAPVVENPDYSRAKIGPQQQPAEVAPAPTAKEKAAARTKKPEEQPKPES